jgi:hypothetical protein
MRGGKCVVFNREHTLNAFDQYMISQLEPLVKVCIPIISIIIDDGEKN